jgi:dephospho-CoA kinase
MADRPVIIGLTGGIGSGKSTCANLARENGVIVYDCDEAIAGAYADARFMRRFRQAFSTATSVTDARACELAKEHADYRRRVSPLLRDFVEPLLFEWELDRLCDFTICLVTPEGERLKRVLARKDPVMTEADFKDVIKNQVNDEFRVLRASKIIDGNESVDRMRAAFLSALESYVPVQDASSSDGDPILSS